MDWTEEYNVNDLGFSLGSVSKASSYDGLTDEEADELKKELDEAAARRLPFGFFAPAKSGKSAGRKAGTFPKVPKFDVTQPAKKAPARAGARAAGSPRAPGRSRRA